MPTYTKPVVELITLDILSTLATITKANGYYNDIGTIERHNRLGNVPADLKCIVFQEDPTEVQEPALMHKEWNQPYSLVVFVIEPDQSTRPVDMRINLIRADIEMALVTGTSYTRGGYAIDTVIHAPEMFDDAKGQLSGIVLHCEVHYRTTFDNPSAQ